MKEYARYIIKQCKGKTDEEQKKILLHLYQDLEERGMKFEEAYLMVVEILTSDIQRLAKELTDIAKDMGTD